MYTKDKAQRITLRLNEEQFAFVKTQSDVLDVSPSELLRMVINSVMVATKVAEERLKKGEVPGRENDETDSNDLV